MSDETLSCESTVFGGEVVRHKRDRISRLGRMHMGSAHVDTVVKLDELEVNSIDFKYRLLQYRGRTGRLRCRPNVDGIVPVPRYQGIREQAQHAPFPMKMVKFTAKAGRLKTLEQ
jgi:hypothetical protein